MRGPIQILSETQAVSETFRLPGGVGFILMDNHAGGTWILEARSPENQWVPLGGPAGVEFDEPGMSALHCASTLDYRLRGGTVGARAWLYGNDDSAFGGPV